MEKRKILISKKTGAVITVFDEKTAPIVAGLGTLEVSRVSTIDFNNEEQKWKAITKDNRKMVIAEGDAEQKKKVYADEVIWANENIKELADIHFPDKSVSFGE